MEEENKKIGVMFVCMGNICRSPMAEAVFQWMIDQESLTAQFTVASSAVGEWHIGERPHPGTLAILSQNHIPLNPEKVSILLKPHHFKQYRYILALDREIASNISYMYGHQVKRLLEYATKHDVLDVPDPYYDHKFKLVYDLVLVGCEGLLKKVREIEDL